MEKHQHFEGILPRKMGISHGDYDDYVSLPAATWNQFAKKYQFDF